jgi:cytoskeleton protein RodZ
MSDAEMNQPPHNEQPENAVQTTSPGAQLAAWRQERGWTVEQVASYLNLAPRQVVAIENDDYPALPGIAVTRGFIRGYAKLLKVDPAPLLAAVGGDTVLAAKPLTPARTLSTPFSESRLPSMTDKPSIPFKWIVAVLLLILAAVALWASQRDWGAAEPKPPSTQQAESPPTAPVAPENPAQPETTAPQTEAAPQQAPDETAKPETDKAATAKAEPVKQEVANPQAGKDMLVLQARADSWIEVRREGSNGTLASRLMKAGEAESFPVEKPLQLVIGNAAGVDATLRGQPLELKGKANTNVARLTVK